MLCNNPTEYIFRILVKQLLDFLKQVKLTVEGNAGWILEQDTLYHPYQL